jgi:hypothetical protein
MNGTWKLRVEDKQAGSGGRLQELNLEICANITVSNPFIVKNETLIIAPKDKTFIMPAGDNRDELIRMYPLVFEMCTREGYNMTGRDHIIAYNKERFV